MGALHGKDGAVADGHEDLTNPSLASIYRALTEHQKAQAHPEAVQQAHADFTALHPTR